MSMRLHACARRCFDLFGKDVHVDKFKRVDERGSPSKVKRDELALRLDIVTSSAIP